MTTYLEEKKTEFKPVKKLLKIDLVSHPARAEGLDKYIQTDHVKGVSSSKVSKFIEE